METEMPFDSLDQKAIALDNSTLFDTHTWSDCPEVEEAVDALYNDLTNSPEFSGHKRSRKKHIKVIILNLYANWLADQTRYIAYSRDKNTYNSKSRYNRIRITYLTAAIVDALRQRGYIPHIY